MKENIQNLIEKIVNEFYNAEVKVLLTIPPNPDFGDFSTNIAFGLAKQLGKNPREIAQEISDKLNSPENLINKVEIAGAGFINIYFDKDNWVKKQVEEILSEGKFLNINIGSGKSASVEHTAANPNKHLHIGHLRNFSIADTLIRVLSGVGYDVTVQWFNDDQGLQVAKVLWGLKNLDKIEIEEFNIEKFKKYDTYAAQVYVATEKYLTIHLELKDTIAEIIKQMEKGNNDVAKFAEVTTRRIIEGQIETITNFGVKYDLMISESTMTQSGEVERILQELFKTGKVVKETEGKNVDCIIIKGIKDSSGKDLDEKILVRSDGTAVYTGKDIVLHLWKFGLLDVNFQFERFNSELSGWNCGNNLYISISHRNDNSETKPQHADIHVNVVDQRQSYPLEIVKQSLKILGFEKESDRLTHLAYETVSLSAETAKNLGYEPEDLDEKVVAMSGRKGIEVSIDSLLETATQKILAYSQHKTTEEKLNYSQANKIAASALRYFMIKYSYNSIIVFDIDDALRADGDTGIYLMYAYVRAQKILEKVPHSKNQPSDEEMNFVVDDVIKDLMLQISLAKDVVTNVATTYQVNELATYTFNLAKKFSDFYQKINVAKEENNVKQEFYLQVVMSFVKVYGELLDLLGLDKPEAM